MDGYYNRGRWIVFVKECERLGAAASISLNFNLPPYFLLIPTHN